MQLVGWVEQRETQHGRHSSWVYANAAIQPTRCFVTDVNQLVDTVVILAREGLLGRPE